MLHANSLTALHMKYAHKKAGLRRFGTVRCMQVLWFYLPDVSSPFEIVFSRLACQHRGDVGCWRRSVLLGSGDYLSGNANTKLGSVWTIRIGARVPRSCIVPTPRSLKRLASYSLPDLKKTDCQQAIMARTTGHGTRVHHDEKKKP